MTIPFSLFVLQFTLLISIKSGDPTHLEELLGTWKPGVPTPGKACRRICHSYHKFLPPSPPCWLHFISYISWVVFFSFFSIMPHISFCLFLFLFLSSRSSSPSLSSLSDSPFSSLLLSPLLCLASLSSHRHTETHRHYTQRKKQNLIVGGAEGHFLSKTVLLHCLLVRPDTWKILTRFVRGE